MLISGDILDKKYEVIRILGKGGMGVVYLCKNKRLGNLWAIKEVKQDTKNIDTFTEANILKDLNHPGIRRIVYTFYANNNFYMVQDYVEGQTLKEYVKVNGKMQIEKICNITCDLCNIVDYLHNLNPSIIYRDIKPSNIMITTNEKVVLIDFGISKIYKNDRSQDTLCAGSNGYAAPEQYGVGKCCKQTDIYGIGMLLYFMVKGRSPLTGVEPLLDESYEENFNNDLKIIMQKCVKIDVKDRYTSVETLKNEILEVLKKEKKEKTIILDDFIINTNICKKVKTKVTNKIKSKGRIRNSNNDFFYIIVVILACIYILNGYRRESDVMNMVDKTELISPIVGSENIEQGSIKKFIKSIKQSSK